ncbi:MAG: hypothetical protein JNN15_07875, partial [Blastocatellia bacterium]|nr:hypothetical protein [Blastocatellia bacterium]
MASLSLLLLEHLAQTIAKELKTASLGHCLRVDHLTAMDAEKVCKLLRSKLKADTLAYLLSLELKNEIQILPEKAIEIRNRKEHKLCIFIPTGKIDSTASSLVNSFASFDLETCFESIAKNLLTELPREIREIVRQIRTVLTGQTEPTAEKWVDYLSTIAQNPTFESTGLEMWRIGLIPDLSGSSLVERLDINKQSVDLLARPRRAQTSIEERLESLKLKKGGVKDQLFTYFKGRRLRELSWLERLSQEPYKGELTFERWSFESLGTSDLEAIEVLPFVDFSGQVEIYTGLRQPNGQGTQPIATVGTKAKVTVKWNSVPSSPENLAHWQAELVTAREDSQGDLFEVELPKTKVSAKVRRASLSLDIDVETLRSRAVQIKVIGLDENGNQLRNIERIPIEGYSTEFWLSDEQISLSEIPIKHKRDTLQSLPYGRLKTAVQTQIDQIQESAGEWDERELSYYNVTINSRKIVRIGMSPILKILEQEVIRNPDDAGLYFAKIDSSEKLKPLEDIVKTDPSPLWFTDAGANFLKKRRELFKAFSLQATSGLVETADLNKDIVRKIKNYNQSYRELLTNSSKEILPLALAIDTLHIEIVHTEKVSEPAVIVMPTHPLRLFWYAAYTELLQHWQAEILKIKTSKERSRLIDLELVSRVAPLNWPAFIYSVKGDSFLFVQNLRFFWGVGLPLGVKDPARLAADVAMTVGLQETEASLADLPPTRITDELKAYRKIHPYLETLKVALINPGSGSFAAEALRHLYISNNEENSTVPARLEITAYTYQPLPLTLEPLAELQKQLYDEQPKGRYNQLSPLCVIAVRDSETIEASANDVNVTLATDQVTPKLSAISNVDFGDSSSLHGLLVRFLPHFQSNEAEAVWNHLLNFPLDSPRERHPVASYYTNSLVDSQRDYLSAMAKLVTPATDQTLAITARLSTQERSRVDSLHNFSDWVITLDRFFGVEFYDNPMDENLKRVAQQYLLDYSPEFLEGLGHRMLVTTSHREEIEEIMSRAMKQLGFSLIEVSVKTILNRLKAISGRLALRVFGDDKKAKEVVSLGIVACYLHSCGDLEDSIIIPVDSHPELFGSKAKHRLEEAERPRCDILQINFHRNRLIATFIEVKYRSESINTPSEKFLDRIVDQIEATENVFRDLFFKINPVRIDHVLQRSRLVAILRFYLYRSWRYGLIRTKQRLKELDEVISKLESGIPDFKAERKGFVLNLKGSKESLSWRNTEIKILTSDELVEAGLVANLEPSLEDLEKKSIQEEFIAPVEIKAKPIVTEQSVTRKDFAENIEV